MRIHGILAGALTAGWCVISAGAAVQPAAPRAVQPYAATSAAKRAVATPRASADAVFFETQVRPILAAQCYSCHGPKIQQAGLRLDSREGLLRGMSGRPAVTPGDPASSPLIAVLSHAGAIKMPPQGKLPQPAIDTLAEWVKQGAPWGASSSGDSKPETRNPKLPLWSFQPLRSGPAPKVKNPKWVRTPVDAFILAALEAKGLAPAPPVDRRKLIRRVTFDLTGLPPTPEEVEAFVADPDPKAYEALVERLLASPAYGERWARHWLDVARYADSNGQEGDQDRPTAYHYRDFVIRALNEDMPFDTFARWQLAGDEYEPDNPQAVAATGFLTAGFYTVLNVPMEEEKIRNRYNELDDVLSTTGAAFLGLTVGCARCHDHKFDPIPTKDYYRLLAAFNAGDRAEVPLLPRAEAAQRRDAERTWKGRLDAARKELDAWLAEQKKPLTQQLRNARIDALPLGEPEKALLRDSPADPKARELARKYEKNLRVEDRDYRPLLTEAQQNRWDVLATAVRRIEAEKPAPIPTALAMADFGAQPRETWLLDRGDLHFKKEPVQLGFLTALTHGRSPADYWADAKARGDRKDTTYQRRALADWMTDPRQGAGALLARVQVNRLWQHHFGEGLVRTVNDFGRQGEAPSHPALLEWLASELVRGGWRLKPIHRLLVTSAAYRQGAAFSARAARVDPDNRLLWRRRPLRIEAESYRDAMLAVAGTLNPQRYGPAFKPPVQPEAIQARNVKDPYPEDAQDAPETRRRTVYMFHKRVVQYPLLQAFDGPDAAASCGRRSITTVAPQALAVLNEPFVRLRSGEFARRLLAAETEPAAQVQAAYRLALGRSPSPMELEASVRFLEQQTTRRAARDTGADPKLLALTDFAQVIFGLNEFLYVD